MTITKFKNTCHLIFNQCSQRIKKVYEDFGYQSRMSFYPYDEKLIGNILDYSSLDNLRAEYFITPNVVNFLVKQENSFHDENELLWGDSIDDYLEDFFVAMILDIQEIPEYSKHLLNLPLIDTNSIKEYFQVNFSLGSSNYDELKDKFIDFTYNQFDTIEILEEDSIFSFIEKDSVLLSSKNSDTFLTFKYLPEKLDLLAKYVLLPIIDKLTLENLINKND
ncbi:TPA: hypothetical protein TXL63_000860 [Streptococcus suis]|nr:hypothetical protein [Streptococcus suis]